MTKGQAKKLDSIIGKIEALQAEVSDKAGALSRAKTLLMDELKKSGH